MASERHVGIGIESTWNTPVAPTAFFELIREQARMVREFVRVKSVRSKSTRQIVELTKMVEWELELWANYQDLPILFYLLAGDVDTTGSGPYTHTVPGSTGLATRPALTLEIKRDSTANTWRYAGCIVERLAMQSNTGDLVKVTLGGIGASESTGTAASPSYPSFDYTAPPHATVNIDASAQDAKQFNLNINYSVDRPHKLGSTSLALQPEDTDVMEVTGDCTIYFEDLTEYAKFDGSTDVDFQWTATDGTHSATINIDKARIIQATPNIEERSRAEQVIEFEAFQTGSVATDPFQFVGINDDVTVP